MGLDCGAATDRGDHGAIYHRLAEFFDHVEDQRRLAGPIDMQEASERFEAGVHDRAPDLRVENSVAIVESGVYRIWGATMLSRSESEVLRD